MEGSSQTTNTTKSNPPASSATATTTTDPLPKVITKILLENKRVVVRSTKDNDDILGDFILSDGYLEITNCIPTEEVSSSPSVDSTSATTLNEGKAEEEKQNTKLDQQKEEAGPSTSATTAPNQPSFTEAKNVVQEEEEKPKQHPLLNPLIIATVFKYLPPKCLKTRRSTCKAWNAALMPRLTLKLSYKNLTKFLRLRRTTLEQSHKTAGEVGQFSKYYIDGIPFGKQDMQTLFNGYGQFMTSLQLEIQIRSNYQLTLNAFRTNIIAGAPNLAELRIVDRGIFNEGCTNDSTANRFWNEGSLFDQEAQFPPRHLPNLKIINFKIISFNATDVGKTFLTELLNAATNLEVLSFNHDSSSKCQAQNDAQTILHALQRKADNLHKLKGLKLHFLPREEVETIIELSTRPANKLSLAKLSFFISITSRTGSEVTNYTRSIYKLLHIQAPSLKSLSVATKDGSYPYHYYQPDEPEPEPFELWLQFPAMNQLEELQLQLGVKLGGIGAEPFLSKFPKLKKFVFLNHDYFYGTTAADTADKHVDAFASGSPSTPHDSVRALQINRIDGLNGLNKLKKLFPNLVQLNIEFDSGKEHLVAELWDKVDKWSRLEHLTISCYEFGDLFDEWLTGIPKAWHYAAAVEAVARRSWDHLKAKPGISDLKYLTHLELKLPTSNWNFQPVNCMTDMSAYFGFLHSATKLTSLIINDPCNKMCLVCRAKIYAILGPDAFIKMESPLMKEYLYHGSREEDEYYERH